MPCPQLRSVMRVFRRKYTAYSNGIRRMIKVPMMITDSGNIEKIRGIVMTEHSATADSIESKAFQSTIDYTKLSQAKLIEQIHTALVAHRHFFQLWQAAANNYFGDAVTKELTEQVYPNLVLHNHDLSKIFYEELNFLWLVMPEPEMQAMLTFASYDSSLLPDTLDEQLDLEKLSAESLALLWNLSTLTYVMQTSRWVETITQHYDQRTALKLETEVWVDRGGAEEDLRYGLIAAGAEYGDVETLLRGFQMAPGEVGLVDAEFQLINPKHGMINHRRCPAHDQFKELNRERLENSCVLCVVAMRLSGEMVNESIRCRPVSLPPHRQSADHACQWEYWMD